MRVLMLAQFYKPTIGGEERHLESLVTELVKRGHDIAIATLWHEGLADFEMDGSVRIYRIRSAIQRASWLYSESGRRHAPPFPDPGALLGLRHVIMQERPDIVHAHNWIIYSFLPLKSWSKAGLVVTLHDYSFSCAKKRLVYQDAPCTGPGLIKCLRCASDHYGPFKGIPTVLSQWTMNNIERSAADMFLPVSHATAVGNGLIGSNLPYQVIPNFVSDDIGADRDAWHPNLAQLPKGDFLLFVGDLSRDKGIHILLEAYEGMVDAPPLVLIGRRGQDTPSEFPHNVLCLNSWPHGAVIEAWHRSTIALAPSTWAEPFGIVVIEAMAAGRPVIASHIGGIPDIVADGETGLLVPPSDPAALKRAMQRLLADPRLRERMGNAGKQKVTEFHASTVVPKIEQVYQKIISNVSKITSTTFNTDTEQGRYNVR